MNDFFEDICQAIEPTTLEKILNSCAVEGFLIAITDTTHGLQDGVKDVLFVGDFFSLPYELFARISQCETCISGITSLSKNKFHNYQSRCSVGYGYFGLTEKNLGQYVLELSVDRGDL